MIPTGGSWLTTAAWKSARKHGLTETTVPKIPVWQAQVLPSSAPSPLSPRWDKQLSLGLGPRVPSASRPRNEAFVGWWGRLGVPSLGSPTKADASTFGWWKVASQSRWLLGSDLFIRHLYNQAVVLLAVCGTRGSEHEPPPGERGERQCPERKETPTNHCPRCSAGSSPADLGSPKPKARINRDAKETPMQLGVYLASLCGFGCVPTGQLHAHPSLSSAGDFKKP